MSDLITISASSKRNGFTLCLAGIIGLCLCLAWFALLPEQLKLAGVFLTSAALVTLLIGWFKVREPAVSFELSREQIMYRNRYGTWQLQWKNLQRVDVPVVQKGLEHIPLDMVGFKIKDYEPLLETISPRLINNLLMEQRSLLMQADRENCNTGQCYGDSMLEDDVYKAESGKTYKGLKAMFANRMNRMRGILGFDLLVYATELDRSENEFIQLLKQCQQQANLEEQTD